MGFNIEQANKNIARMMRRAFKEDLEIIFGFFGCKVKEKNK